MSLVCVICLGAANLEERKCCECRTPCDHKFHVGHFRCFGDVGCRGCGGIDRVVVWEAFPDKLLNAGLVGFAVGSMRNALSDLRQLGHLDHSVLYALSRTPFAVGNGMFPRVVEITVKNAAQYSQLWYLALKSVLERRKEELEREKVLEPAGSEKSFLLKDEVDITRTDVSYRNENNHVVVFRFLDP